MIFILKQTKDQFPSSIHLKGLIAMTNSIPTNNHQGSLEKWLIYTSATRNVQDESEISCHSKQVIKDYWACVKRI